ncbi:MAG TPA: ribosome maturation factor RimP [Candidatus Obscuribacterales bacterium]
MTHPLIPKVLDLAAPLAERLGLDVVDAVFQTNHSPPVLRIDVRNCQQEDTSLHDCEQMSQALEALLDETDLLPDAYVLEVSSPGISSELTSDRDFIVFKGFMVEVQLTEPYKNRQTWVGQLLKRDADHVYLTRKGQPIKLPRAIVHQVQLSDQAPE